LPIEQTQIIVKERQNHIQTKDKLIQRNIKITWGRKTNKLLGMPKPSCEQKQNK
jgi:hypothetical protein